MSDFSVLDQLRRGVNLHEQPIAPDRCPECNGAGWVLDAKLDKHPTTLELIPCIYPPCEYSGRDVAVLCLYGEWENPVLHPKTGAVMSLAKTAATRWPKRTETA